MSYSDRTAFDLMLREGGISNFRDAVVLLKEYSIEGVEKEITCLVPALSSEGECNEFERQAKEFM